MIKFPQLKNIKPPNLKFPLVRDAVSLGLDMGSASVKLVKLKFAAERVELLSFAVEPYEQSPESALKKILSQQDIRKVNIAVSGPSTIIRYVDFPKMKEEEFKQALKFEAQKHIPFSISEVNLDGVILREDLPDNKMLVLLAAVKKDTLGAKIKLCEDLGFKINIIDIDSLATINTFNFNYSLDDSLKGKTVALLNIGAVITNLSILEDGLPRLSRDIHIAGNSVTQKIADTLGVDFKTAESLKLAPNEDLKNKINAAAEAVFSHLAREIRISFDFYESQSSSSVEKIFLSGAGSISLGLKGVLNNLLGIDVDFWDPFKALDIGQNLNPESARNLAVQLTVALGLALRR